MQELRTWQNATMTANSKIAARKRAGARRSESAAWKRAERDACAVWRACLGCGRPFPSEGIHNRLCGGCRNAARSVGSFDEYAL